MRKYFAIYSTASNHTILQQFITFIRGLKMALELSSIKQKFAKFLKNKHIAIPLVIVLMCIAVWLCFGTVFAKSSASKKQSITNTGQQYDISSNEALNYANQVASTLQNAINNVKGVSGAKVVVVVENSPIINYLTEEGADSKQVIVYDKQGSNYKPVATCQFLPKITGVLVVAKGVQDLNIKYNILNAIAAVYNVNVSNIEILEGK